MNVHTKGVMFASFRWIQNIIQTPDIVGYLMKNDKLNLAHYKTQNINSLYLCLSNWIIGRNVTLDLQHYLMGNSLRLDTYKNFYWLKSFSASVLMKFVMLAMAKNNVLSMYFWLEIF